MVDLMLAFVQLLAMTQVSVFDLYRPGCCAWLAGVHEIHCSAKNDPLAQSAMNINARGNFRKQETGGPTRFGDGGPEGKTGGGGGGEGSSGD